jgi:hypothetical protein
LKKVFKNTAEEKVLLESQERGDLTMLKIIWRKWMLKGEE